MLSSDFTFCPFDKVLSLPIAYCALAWLNINVSAVACNCLLWVLSARFSNTAFLSTNFVNKLSSTLSFSVLCSGNLFIILASVSAFFSGVNSFIASFNVSWLNNLLLVCFGACSGDTRNGSVVCSSSVIISFWFLLFNSSFIFVILFISSGEKLFKSFCAVSSPYFFVNFSCTFSVLFSDCKFSCVFWFGVSCCSNWAYCPCKGSIQATSLVFISFEYISPLPAYDCASIFDGDTNAPCSIGVELYTVTLPVSNAFCISSSVKSGVVALSLSTASWYVFMSSLFSIQVWSDKFLSLGLFSWIILNCFSFVLSSTWASSCSDVNFSCVFCNFSSSVKFSCTFFSCAWFSWVCSWFCASTFSFKAFSFSCWIICCSSVFSPIWAFSAVCVGSMFSCSFWVIFCSFSLAFLAFSASIRDFIAWSSASELFFALSKNCCFCASVQFLLSAITST